MAILNLIEKLKPLHDRIEEKASLLVQLYDVETYQCAGRCHECCSSYFKIGSVEAARLWQGFKELPIKRQIDCLSKAGELCQMLDIYQDALDRYLDDDPGLAKDYEAPQKGTKPFFIQCPLLDENGLCLVYAYRPLTCHAYGQPRKATNSSDGVDYCYRNFRNLNAGAKIPAHLILDYQEILRDRNQIERELYEVVLGKRVNRFFHARIAEFLVLGLDTLKWDEFLTNVSSQAFIAMEFVKHICPAELFTDLHQDETLFESVCEWHAAHSGDPAIVQEIDSVLDALEKLMNSGQLPAYSRIRSLAKERGTLFLGYIVLNISQRYLNASR